jgi:hypothetical protein
MQFFHNNFSHDIINDVVVCILFFLTFKGEAEKWCETLSNAYIHTWKQFFHNIWYDFDDLYSEIESLGRKQGESVEDFVLIFSHTCHRFTLDDNPSINKIIEWYLYLLSL